MISRDCGFKPHFLFTLNLSFTEQPVKGSTDSSRDQPVPMAQWTKSESPRLAGLGLVEFGGAEGVAAATKLGSNPSVSGTESPIDA